MASLEKQDLDLVSGRSPRPAEAQGGATILGPGCTCWAGQETRAVMCKACLFFPDFFLNSRIAGWGFPPGYSHCLCPEYPKLFPLPLFCLSLWGWGTAEQILRLTSALLAWLLTACCHFSLNIWLIAWGVWREASFLQGPSLAPVNTDITTSSKSAGQ